VIGKPPAVAGLPEGLLHAGRFVSRSGPAIEGSCRGPHIGINF